MRLKIPISLSLPLLLLCLAQCRERPSARDLFENKVMAQIAEIEGDVALAFYDLSSPDSLFIEPDTVFHAASTMKVPVMIELYRQAAEGQLSLSDSILLENGFKSIVDGSPYKMDIREDSDDVVYGKLGSKVALKELLHPMITVSSNLATNILIQMVDAKKVTARMRTLGAKKMKVLRGVEDQKAYDRGLNNTTTARDLMLVMRAIAEHTAASPEDCREMVQILKEQQFNEMIPHYLPKEVQVAHKTGFITGLHHDAAIVYLPNGKAYVLVLLSKNLKDFKKGTEQLAQISKTVYDHVMGN